MPGRQPGRSNLVNPTLADNGVVPRRRRSFGWAATVSHWDDEHHEVQLDFVRDRVRDVQLRVGRARLGGAGSGA